jgi:hypothetical protein
MKGLTAPAGDQDDMAVPFATVRADAVGGNFDQLPLLAQFTKQTGPQCRQYEWPGPDEHGCGLVPILSLDQLFDVRNRRQGNLVASGGHRFAQALRRCRPVR